jgi:hypothetical protein
MTITTSNSQDHEQALQAVIQATNLPRARVAAVIERWQETGESGPSMVARTVILCYRSARLALDQKNQEVADETMPFSSESIST